MQVNQPTFIDRTLKLDSAVLPALPQSTINIFCQYSPSFESTPCNIKNSVSSLELATKSLAEGPQKIRSAHLQAKIHKILSITLLAITVSLIATAIILGVLLNPVFGMIFTGVIVTCIASTVLKHYLEEIETEDDETKPLPLLTDVLYVEKAFTTKKFQVPSLDDRQQSIQKARQLLDDDLNRLQTLQRLKAQVEQGITQELRSIDLAKSGADRVRVNELRSALASFAHIDTFIELLNE